MVDQEGVRIFTKQGVWGDLGLLPPGEQELPTQVCHTGFLNINRDDDDDNDDDDDDQIKENLRSAFYPSLAVTRSHSWQRHVG